MVQENEKTVLTLKHSGGKMVWEGSWDSSLDDIMTGFVGCLRGVSFGEWIIKAIKEWAEEQLDETTCPEKDRI